MNKRLLISFSGGRTSAYMTWWLLNEWSDRGDWEFKVVYANTGKEVEGTLEFINNFYEIFGVEIIWVESVPFTEKGWGVIHEIVNFKSASREGEPFEAMIKKLGIPCQAAPFCSEQLKKCAIESYMKSIGWVGYHKAIGIRADEIDRMNPNFRKEKIIYPLISMNPTNKKMVIDWWKRQVFDLKIDDDLGNCDCCWKKSIKRLTRISDNHPNLFKWWGKMTDKYSDIRERKGAKNATQMNFYRGNRSTEDIFKLAELSNRQLSLFAKKEKLDGCSETCEAF